MSKILENLKYTKEHEWIKSEGDIVTIGITDFAQSQLGDIVYLELPEIGEILKSGDSFGVVESIKSVSDLYSPITGEVFETNLDLIENPGKINEDAYQSWMLKIKCSITEQSINLLDHSAYNNFCS